MKQDIAKLVPNFDLGAYSHMDHTGNSASIEKAGTRDDIANHDILKKLHDGGDCPYELFFTVDPNHDLFMNASRTIYDRQLSMLDDETLEKYMLEDGLTDEELAQMSMLTEDDLHKFNEMVEEMYEE